MPTPHVIRLRGPWSLKVLERDPPAPPAPPTEHKVAVPGDWAETLGAGFCGSVRYTRRFNRPTNLEAQERVWLVVAGVDHQASVTLNGRPLGTAGSPNSPARFDVTADLTAYNLLVV